MCQYVALVLYHYAINWPLSILVTACVFPYLQLPWSCLVYTYRLVSDIDTVEPPTRLLGSQFIEWFFTGNVWHTRLWSIYNELCPAAVQRRDHHRRGIRLWRHWWGHMWTLMWVAHCLCYKCMLNQIECLVFPLLQVYEQSNWMFILPSVILYVILFDPCHTTTHAKKKPKTKNVYVYRKILSFDNWPYSGPWSWTENIYFT